jgi:6-phosphofructokinase 1
VDVDQAYAVGKAAVQFALQGKTAVMPIIVRKSSRPYRWGIGEAPLAAVANLEKTVPRHFITPDGFGITQSCRRYLLPLIGGESYPPYSLGLPRYIALKGAPVAKRLRTPFVI